MPPAAERLNVPPTTEWPAVLVQYLKACLWKRMLVQHEGIANVMQWLFIGQKNPLTGERIPYGATPESLYPILLEAAEQWHQRTTTKAKEAA